MFKDGAPLGQAGGFDVKSNALPAEMLPSQIDYDGVNFTLAAAKTRSPDATIARRPDRRAAL